MRLRIAEKLTHVDSGTYRVQVVEVTVRETRETRKPQLKTMLEVIHPRDFEGACFYYLIMLDGSSNRYLDRFVRAADPRLNPRDFETNELLGKCMTMDIKNQSRSGGEPNYYPEVTDVRPIDGASS